MRSAELQLHQEQLDMAPVSVAALEQQAGHTSDAYPEGGFDATPEQVEQVETEPAETPDAPQLQSPEPNEEELSREGSEYADWPNNTQTWGAAHIEYDKREAEDRADKATQTATEKMNEAADRLGALTSSLDGHIAAQVESGVEKRLGETGAAIGSISTDTLKDTLLPAVEETVDRTVTPRVKNVDDKLAAQSGQVEDTRAKVDTVVDRIPEDPSKNEGSTKRTVGETLGSKWLQLCNLIGGIATPSAIAMSQNNPTLYIPAALAAVGTAAHIGDKVISHRREKREAHATANLTRNAVRLAMGGVTIELAQDEEVEE